MKNLNRVLRLVRQSCPRCTTYDDHTVGGWVLVRGMPVRAHCCRYCGQEWLEAVNPALTERYLCFIPSTRT